MMLQFTNATYLDFNCPEIAKNQRDAIDAVRSKFGKEYPNYIDGKESITDKKTISTNPANPSEIIGVFQKAGQKEADAAIKAAAKAFETWRYVPAEVRANYLFHAADEIRSRRLEINAWMISEIGKTYLEADADTCEAIDFLEFYGREAIRYAQPQELVEFPGELDEYLYVPLGVGVVIPPWNFPFAIMTGITVSAIVTGNTVVLKPSSDTPMMAWLLADIMKRIGLPDGVLNYLVASGGEAGDFLVEHPLTRFISFTGSKDVGLGIFEKANKVSPGQKWIKRVVAEMGGKDGIIVDSEADVDAAAAAVCGAAFSFQGQKCSACSRAMVDAKVYDEFVEKLKENVAKLTIGDPSDNPSMGPSANKSQYETVLKYIEIGKTEGKLVCGGNKIENEKHGFFVEPTVFIDLKEDSRLMQEEIFGPVLAVCKVKDYDHALKVANNTEYGLTGAVFTKNPHKIERAKREFHCGNLYINRKCTGAMVGVHPFGGFNMSGTDSKAGSRDYLALFLQGKSIASK
ncbi:MAG: L-glutamate gamma-semialdehyde dehydrogenase [Ignavibacteria bacterium]|nr:L-glutamate gamma-semialdehyde dehydrogenase [Ignavibacteria bacterium]